MKAQKEAEKPFWWEHLHPNVKDQTIEEIEKHIIEAGTPAEKLAEMTKYEKYMAVSEGCYMIDSEQAKQISVELDSLKKEVERSKTSFINQPAGIQQQQPVQDIFEPIAFGQKPVNVPSSIPSAIPSSESSFDTPPAVKVDEGIMPSLVPASPMPLDNMGAKENVADPFGAALVGSSVGSAAAPNSAQIRQYAQSIVSKVVSDVNAKADSIPDDVAVMKEQELLQAVIKELQTLK